MIVIVGAIIGIICGVAQYFLLSRFSRGITSDGIAKEAIVCGIVQFILPFAVLIGVAFLRKDDLLPAGIGIVAALFGSAMIAGILSRIKSAQQADNDEAEESDGESDEEGDI